MQTSGITDIAHGIQLAVAPVFLLSGVGAGVALERNLSRLIVVLFVAGLCAFIGALVAFLLEIQAATACLRFGPGPH
jgi:hypothetical protein